MNKKQYQVICPECEEELFEGDKLQIENWLKSTSLDGYEEFEEDEEYYTCPCSDCLRLLKD